AWPSDAGPQAGIRRRADGDRRFEIAGRDQSRWFPEPAGQRLCDPLAGNWGSEESTVEEHQILTDHTASVRQHRCAVIGRKDGCGAQEKCREMTSDRRIGFV